MKPAVPSAAESDPVFPPEALRGLDLLATATVLLDREQRVRHLNAAAEHLLAVSRRAMLGQPLERLFAVPPALSQALSSSRDRHWSYAVHNLGLTNLDGLTQHVDCIVTPADPGGAHLLLEVRPIDQQLKAAREEQLAQQQQVSRELVRNLAHEIKNPLGGIRGSAQLLERELDSPALREYTQVIVKEADRLQDLMKRLLSSHRAMQPAPVAIHEILEHVRSLIQAEYSGVRVRRDYDTSLPELTGDREQLIQAVLNIARNAAQALAGQGEIVLRTRAARHVTLAKRHHRLAVEIAIIDNGPGVPEDMRERIFFPLVSGSEHGSGLGLTIAQSFIQQHGGSIELESRPGRTAFNLILPVHPPISKKAGP